MRRKHGEKVERGRVFEEERVPKAKGQMKEKTYAVRKT